MAYCSAINTDQGKEKFIEFFLRQIYARIKTENMVNIPFFVIPL